MKNLLRRVLTVALCAALVGGTAVSLPAVLPDMSITANAAYTTTRSDYIYFDNSKTKWDEVYAFWWHSDYARTYDLEDNDWGCVKIISDDSTEHYEPVKYPGTKMKQVAGTDIWQARIPFGATMIIFDSGKTDKQIMSGEIGYTTRDLYFDQNKCAGNIYRIDTYNYPQPGRGKYSTMYTYDGGSWNYYSGEYLSEVVGSSSPANSEYNYYVNSYGKITITGYKGSQTDISIPSSINDKIVTGIWESAFAGCSSLTSITIPDSVTRIYEGAFRDCSNLKSITIPNSVISIGDNAFSGCNSLTSITIPDTVTSISGSAFRGCKGLADSKGLVIVKGVLYDYLGDDTTITIPSNVTSISESAFENCSNLKSINVDKNNSNYSSVDGILYNKNKTEFIFCPKAKTTADKIPSGVTSISDGAFAGCSSLTSITIPDSVTRIYEGAFRDCSNLKSITIPNSVISIGDNAFSGCSSLTKITIPDSVKSIGWCAFGNCISLKNITIPDSVTLLNNDAFKGCKGLADSKGFVVIKGVLHDYLGDDTDITIPSSVTSIGWSAFMDCSSLTSITMPSSVTGMDDYVFENCTSLTSINVDNNNTNYSSVDGILYNKDKTKMIFCPKAKTTADMIPNSVTSIGYKVFTGCSRLTSITIPDSVTWIGWDAFYGCSNLTIHAKSGSYAEKYANDNGFKFVDVLLTNTSSVSANSVVKNDTVTITGSASGAKAPYTYAYYYKKSTDSTWTKIAGYSADTSKTFKPTTAGTYNVRVNVKDSTGETVKKDFTVKVKAESPLTNNSSVSAESVTANTAVTLTGNAAGGKAPYTYAYYYKKSTDSSWTKIAGYSTDTSKTFKPTTAGTYTARVNVKDSAGTLVQKDFTVTVKDDALKNNSIVSATDVKAGTEVTMTGKATGGTAPYTYAYYYKKSTDSSWTKIAGYSTSTMKNFKPAAAGTYTVRVNVKDSTGKLVQKDLTVTVTADSSALTNNSTISATTVKAGTEVTMTGKATGGTSPYKYAYYYKKSTESTWTKAYVTSSGSAYTKYDSKTFTPKTAGTYDVRINVRDEYGNGKTVTKDFKITVK